MSVINKFFTTLLLYSSIVQADFGPFYIYYPGYCNVKQAYINDRGNLYGKEIGCTASIGDPIIGVSSDVAVNVARINRNNGTPCIDTYWFNGTLGGGCSSGTSISYSPAGTYGVRSMIPSGESEISRITWGFQEIKPDLEAIRGLPPLPD